MLLRIHPQPHLVGLGILLDNSVTQQQPENHAGMSEHLSTQALHWLLTPRSHRICPFPSPSLALEPFPSGRGSSTLSSSTRSTSFNLSSRVGTTPRSPAKLAAGISHSEPPHPRMMLCTPPNTPPTSPPQSISELHDNGQFESRTLVSPTIPPPWETDSEESIISGAGARSTMTPLLEQLEFPKLDEGRLLGREDSMDDEATLERLAVLMVGEALEALKSMNAPLCMDLL
ncbi:hypothetical protein T439DRAFT_244967 [Meredithblackwellia eburnea MCA 4105]